MDGNQAANQQQAQAQAAQNTQNATQIDYEKLAQIVTGKQQATEDSVLKGYFKQQGLRQEEMTQATKKVVTMVSVIGMGILGIWQTQKPKAGDSRASAIV